MGFVVVWVLLGSGCVGVLDVVVSILVGILFVLMLWCLFWLMFRGFGVMVLVLAAVLIFFAESGDIHVEGAGAVF